LLLGKEQLLRVLQWRIVIVLPEACLIYTIFILLLLLFYFILLYFMQSLSLYCYVQCESFLH